MDNISPFVTVQFVNSFKIYGEDRPTTYAVINCKLDPEKSVTSFPTIEEVEDWFVVNPGMTSKYSYADPYSLAIAIMRASNEVAKEINRGPGNVVMMSEDLANYLFHSTHNSLVSPNTALLGRWIRFGLINNTISVWATKDFPAGKIAVAYRGYSAPDSATTVFKDDLYHVFDSFAPLDWNVLMMDLDETA